MTDSPHSQRFLGIMSGTSLDGLDVVLIQRQGPAVRVERGRTYPYEPSLRQALHDLCAPGENEIDRMLHADIQLARFIATTVNGFLAEAR